jgi:hypothetical protein
LRVLAATRSGRFSTLLTVPMDTPAWRATSLMLVVVNTGKPFAVPARDAGKTV